ncbi:uncharacterized protein L3040_000926 [Drepanopeziza brunnea f. sp. 'multigermtubi']|uniref:uncharacterized protein n=1 Tax=Drepanopeziza brunnea f. sp. 'multigermtubi' TaxID=698441 RepID=UPI002391B204|nr:hypothetical protein L3040_000926 [Drepanopeziza brunnea f. sp. 'multigermtubi']
MPLFGSAGASVGVIVGFSARAAAARGRRSATGWSSSGDQLLSGTGAGLRSTRIVPERARRSNVDPNGSETADWALSNCSPTNLAGAAEDNVKQNEKIANRRKRLWELGLDLELDLEDLRRRDGCVDARAVKLPWSGEGHNIGLGNADNEQDV